MATNNSTLGNIASIGVDVNLTAQSTVYLCLALCIPILLFFICRRIL